MPLRDLLITTVIGLLLLGVLKYPVMGSYLWAWVSLMNPHKLTYGFAFDMPFAMIIAGVTMTALVLTSKRQAPPVTSATVLWAMLMLWFTVTSFFAMAASDVVLDRWIFVMKIQLMTLVTWMLVRQPNELRTLIWIVTFSVAFYGIKGGIWTVATGGGRRVWGPPGGMLEGNNELAVGLVMLTPMLYYLRQTASRAWARYLLLFSIVAVTFSILGSQSRGALLALLAMAFFLGLKGKRPVRTSLVLGIFFALAIAFMPENWSSRMETIQTYEADNSAMSRLWTWTTLTRAALDHPFVGLGFQADNAAVFAKYAPLDGQFAVFAGRVYVAHSIYFQMLGEHGFVGLALFLLLGVTCWRTASRVARQATGDAEFGSWMPLLMRMCQVSLVGYAVGGAFLSIGYLDLPYYIMTFIVLCDVLARKRARSPNKAPERPAVPLTGPRGLPPDAGEAHR